MSVINRLRLLKKRLTGTSKPAIIAPAETARQFEGYCFIAGMHRSGTTLVEHHLRALADVVGLAANVPENEGQHLQDVVPAGRSHGGPGRFAFSTAMHTPPAEAGAAAGQRDRLLRCWTPFMQGEGRVFLEKSPPNLVRIPWLRSVFPGARFLIVTRHPVASAAATQKWAKSTISELVYHWHVAHSAALSAAKGAPDCVFVRYEDLCADPAATLERLIPALGLTPRATALPIEERFRSFDNSNEKYLSQQPARYWGPGAWDALGYSDEMR